MKEYFDILFTFLRIGLFTFGGGYAIIPVVERELVTKKRWITMEEVMDFYTISQIMPGLIGVNLLIFVGNKRKGIIGGLLGAVGFIIPGATLILLVAMFISNFAEIPAVRQAFAGIRIAVAALILDTVIKLVKGVFKEARTLLIYLFVFILSALPAGILPPFMGSPAFLVLASGITGLIIFSRKKPGAKP